MRRALAIVACSVPLTVAAFMATAARAEEATSDAGYVADGRAPLEILARRFAELETKHGWTAETVYAYPDAPGLEINAWRTSSTGPALWVLSGALVIIEGGERHELGTGDCLGFGPPAEVTFANESNAPCTYVVALARS